MTTKIITNFRPVRGTLVECNDGRSLLKIVEDLTYKVTWYENTGEDNSWEKTTLTKLHYQALNRDLRSATEQKRVRDGDSLNQRIKFDTTEVDGAYFIKDVRALNLSAFDILTAVCEELGEDLMDVSDEEFHLASKALQDFSLSLNEASGEAMSIWFQDYSRRGFSL